MHMYQCQLHVPVHVSAHVDVITCTNSLSAGINLVTRALLRPTNSDKQKHYKFNDDDVCFDYSRF